jgi:ubiquinone/menaquinone biosynthesis C-methylase UbiE
MPYEGRRTVNADKKFDPKKLDKLNDPRRLEYLNPDFIWEKAALPDPAVLVDIGAGTGFFALLFSRKMKEGKVYACDISSEMISWMNGNLPAESKGKLIPVKMEETSVPLSGGMADLVYMINLHHELEDPVMILKESFRLLKKSGKVIVIDWKKEETPEGPPLGLRVEEEAIESHMRDAGFSEIAKYRALPYHYFLIGKKNSEMV